MCLVELMEAAQMDMTVCCLPSVPIWQECQLQGRLVQVAGAADAVGIGVQGRTSFGRSQRLRHPCRGQHHVIQVARTLGGLGHARIARHAEHAGHAWHARQTRQVSHRRGPHAGGEQVHRRSVAASDKNARGVDGPGATASRYLALCAGGLRLMSAEPPHQVW